MKRKTQALIVDDDNDTANLFSTILGLVGFECEITNSARAALAYLAGNEPDILLLDMRLGLEISGNDILYQIRSNPRLDRMRVIVITAYPQMAEPVSDLADLVLLKPVEVEELGLMATRFANMPPQSYLFQDPVTNLDTRKFFETRLELAFERMKRRPDFLFSVMAIAIEVNRVEGDQRQEEETDLLIKAMSAHLRKGFRPTDTFGRLDRERIVALFEDLKQPGDAGIIIQRLRQQLCTPYIVRSHTLDIALSIGAVLSDPSFSTAGAILESAEKALEIARQSPGGGDYIL